MHSIHPLYSVVDKLASCSTALPYCPACSRTWRTGSIAWVGSFWGSVAGLAWTAESWIGFFSNNKRTLPNLTCLSVMICLISTSGLDWWGARRCLSGLTRRLSISAVGFRTFVVSYKIYLYLLLVIFEIIIDMFVARILEFGYFWFLLNSLVKISRLNNFYFFIIWSHLNKKWVVVCRVISKAQQHSISRRTWILHRNHKFINL